MLLNPNFTLRLPQPERKMLQELAAGAGRSRGNMILFLIRENWKLIKAKKAEEKSNQEQPAAL